MKEKMKGLWHIITGVGGLVIGGLVIMAFFGVFDDEAEEILNGEDISQTAEMKESGEGTAADGNDVAANQNNTDIDAVVPGDPDYKKYIHVGDKCKLVNGGTMEILDAGYGFGTVYVLVEFTSGDVEALQFDQSDATLYIDDYEVPVGVAEQLAMENGYIFISGDTSYPTQASANAGGRKASMVFVSDISDDISENAEIEFDITGAIFKINPLTTGQAKRNTNEAMGVPNEEEYQVIFGKFSMAENMSGGESIANISSDANGNYYINMICLEGGETVLVFEGTLQEKDTEYIADSYDEDEEVSFLVSFDTENKTMGVRPYTSPASNSEEAETHEMEMLSFVGQYTLIDEIPDHTMTYTSSMESSSNSSGIVYGTYSLSPNGVGGHSEAEIGFYTDDEGGDYIYIADYEEEYDFPVYEFTAYLQNDGDSYIATDKYGVSYRVTFSGAGFTLDILPAATADDYDKVFIGNYKLISKLNFDNVG